MVLKMLQHLLREMLQDIKLRIQEARPDKYAGGFYGHSSMVSSSVYSNLRRVSTPFRHASKQSKHSPPSFREAAPHAARSTTAPSSPTVNALARQALPQSLHLPQTSSPPRRITGEKKESPRAMDYITCRGKGKKEVNQLSRCA